MENSNEAVKAFQVFTSHHSRQQKALYDQMTLCVKELLQPDARFTNPNSAASRRKRTANRISMATMNSLALYITAHHSLLGCLVQDIADGRIGKLSRKVVYSKKKIGQKKFGTGKLNRTESELSEDQEDAIASEAVTPGMDNNDGGEKVDLENLYLGKKSQEEIQEKKLPFLKPAKLIFQ